MNECISVEVLERCGKISSFLKQIQDEGGSKKNAFRADILKFILINV